MKRNVTYAAIAAIIACAFVSAHREGGTSPVLWYDTTAEQDWVEHCLRKGICSTYGVGSSVAGIQHGTSWMRMRAIMDAAGLDLGAVNIITQGLDAIGAGLTALAASWLAGPLAAAFAAIAYLAMESVFGLSHAILFNCRIVPFLGALFTVLAAMFAVNGRLRFGLAAGFVLATLADLYAASLAMMPALAAVGALVPQRRIRATLLPVFVAIGTLFVLSPSAWWGNVINAFSSFSAIERRWSITGVEVAAWIALVIAGFGAIFLKDGMRRRLLLATVFCMGAQISAFECAKALGVAGGNDIWYLLPVLGPVVIGACGTLASTLEGLLHRKGTLLRWGQNAAPFVAAVGLAAWPRMPYAERELQTFTYAEVREVQRVLTEELGWDLEQTLYRVRAPHLKKMVLAFLTFPSDFLPSTKPFEKVAYVFKAREPIPPDWRVVTRSDDTAVILKTTDEWLDYRDFEICRDDGCRKTGFQVTSEMFSQHVLAIEGLPTTPSSVTMRIPFRGPPNETRLFSAPRMPGACVPSRLHVHGGEVSADGRTVTVRSGPYGAEGVLELAMYVGGPDCATGDAGFLPLVIESKVGEWIP